jgi:hypothetical protein
MRNPASPNRSKKTWQARTPFVSSKSGRDRNDEHLSRETTRQSARSHRSTAEQAWWKTRLFSGMINDIRRRAPFYWSDWKDAWDYRVVPATVYMYFAKYVPAIQYFKQQRTLVNLYLHWQYTHCRLFPHQEGSALTSFGEAQLTPCIAFYLPLPSH